MFRRRSGRISHARDCSKDWRQKELIALLNAFEAMPALWNMSEPEYKNSKAKVECYNTLGRMFNTTGGEVKRKLHNMRSQFNAELKRMRIKFEGLNPAFYTCEWKYFDHMKFLIDTHKKIEDKEQEDYIITVSTYSDDSDDSVIFVETPTSSTEVIPKVDNTVAECNSTGDLSKSVQSSTDKKYQVFSEYVASELSSLSERSAKKLKLMVKKL